MPWSRIGLASSGDSARRGADSMDFANGLIHLHTGFFGQTERKSIATDEEFDRVSQRRGSQVLDLLPFDQPHFHEANRHGVISRDIRDTRPFPGFERVERSHGRATSTRTTASSSPRKLRR